ncbi:helix-turn-helix domain-containing protein [Pedobacter sp. Leaf250]|uniref:helix-turn-helix domain-containing protein n=1 Tax=Pedobacter sp. Leaf250 TaxID=2876559 RepID=UPI001E5BF979|nr:helix-turn-helix domain-containing protein [Pedobacter sp. Leaf250]
MQIEILTWEDLQRFRKELIEDINAIVKPGDLKTGGDWLRSAEVRKLLKISPGTLQNLRINGALPFQKIGSIMYYAHSDIVKLLDKIGRG